MSNINKRHKYLHWIACSVVGLVFLMTCTADSLKIYTIHDSEKTFTAFQPTSKTARTDAGVTITNFRFKDDQLAQLEIRLEFKKAVPPEFASGSFALHMGDEIYRGMITPVNFRYLGGQGDGVSVGGDFRFSTPELEYQFHLPLTQLDTFGY
ncbi:MAG: hypothetical protein K9N34_02305 [Candidatus Marinimicrobia bacterium]|nr:hypothetical protein [Candidatus Neomarinimicrobiota bacterium]MCF7840829.1 hypothetical protein [Candidatus Neomarinimicrobiota bacterium]MCF7901820.1 hypothetical protein [Candidatus Neomarinimicrobiota bacterium]